MVVVVIYNFLKIISTFLSLRICYQSQSQCVYKPVILISHKPVSLYMDNCSNSTVVICRYGNIWKALKRGIGWLGLSPALSTRSLLHTTMLSRTWRSSREPRSRTRNWQRATPTPSSATIPVSIQYSIISRGAPDPDSNPYPAGYPVNLVDPGRMRIWPDLG